MPAHPAGGLSKGMVQKAADLAANTMRQPFLTVLETDPGSYGENWVQFLVDHLGLEPFRQQYLLDYWFNRPQPPYPGRLGFWQNHQPIEPIIRQSMIEAIKLADAGVPSLQVDSYWMSGGDRVEVYLTRSAQQITRIIVTPPPPAPVSPNHTMPNPADIWVIKTCPREQEISRDPSQEGYWHFARLRSE